MRLTSEKQIPLKIQACAHGNDLGTPRIMYEPHKESRLYLVLGPFALVVAVCIMVMYQVYYDRVFEWWPTWQSMIVPGIGFAWFLIGIWTLLTPLTAPHLRLYLCPRGLIYSRRGLAVIRWDRIALLYKELRTATQSAQHVSPLLNYTILREDGTSFVLHNDLPYLERLGGFIEREIVRYLLPGSISTYEANLVQSFGPLLVDRDGISLWRDVRVVTGSEEKPLSVRKLPWSDFDHITIDDTTLNIYQHGDSWAWATLSLSGLPNLYVFKGLLDHVMKYLHVPVTEEPVISSGTEAQIAAAQFAAYDAGFSLFFGMFSISKEGVSLNNGEEIIPWEEIASFGIGESEVMLKRLGSAQQWYAFPLWTITDLDLLQQVVDYAFYQHYIS